MQPFFTIVYIRITTLTWIFHDHPLVEYPLYNENFRSDYIFGYYIYSVSSYTSSIETPILLNSLFYIIYICCAHFCHRVFSQCSAKSIITFYFSYLWNIQVESFLCFLKKIVSKLR